MEFAKNSKFAKKLKFDKKHLKLQNNFKNCFFSNFRKIWKEKYFWNTFNIITFSKKIKKIKKNPKTLIKTFKKLSKNFQKN